MGAAADPSASSASVKESSSWRIRSDMARTYPGRSYHWGTTVWDTGAQMSDRRANSSWRTRRDDPDVEMENWG